jgi:ribose 5-phosphate isomerase RpiB
MPTCWRSTRAWWATALDIVDAFLSAQFEGGRHATRVEMIAALEE